jgi:ribonuclease VapC
MIVVDTSVLIAILKDEQDAPELIERLGEASKRYVSAGSMLECGIVVAAKYGSVGLIELQNLHHSLQMETVPFDADQARVGYQAFSRFGRGSKHPARLNFGDCFAYALASTRNLPLLFKGDDFLHTDIRPALTPG